MAPGAEELRFLLDSNPLITTKFYVKWFTMTLKGNIKPTLEGEGDLVHIQHLFHFQCSMQHLIEYQSF